MEEEKAVQTKKKKNSNEPSYLLIILIVGALLVWAWFGLNGKKEKKEPNYALYAQTYSQMYIKENCYSDADFPTQKYEIVDNGRQYDVTGKFNHDGVVYRFKCIGEFPKASTDEYHIVYLVINNNVILDAREK